MKPVTWARVRRWVYGVSVAAVPVCVYFGVIPAEASPVVLPLLLALFNVQDGAPGELAD